MAKPLGLAFSGGGIRSATFNLGVIQGLADLGLLRYVDYLSTVSGGGYIGSWLHGVIRNNHKGDPAAASEYLSASLSSTPGRPGVNPITFLRKYSNYLAPRPGLFSADTWVIGLIWLRNMFLNQLILVPALSSAIVVALLLVFAQQVPSDVFAPVWRRVLAAVAAVVAIAALALAVTIAGKNLAAVVQRLHFPGKEAADDEPSRDEKADRKTPLEATDADKARWWEHASLAIAPCVFGASILLGCIDLGHGRYPSFAIAVVVLSLLFAGFQWKGGFKLCYETRHPDGSLAWLFHIIWMPVIAAALGGGLLVLLGNASIGWEGWNRIAFAPPLVSLSLVLAVAVHIGLMGADYPDGAREWIARVASTLVLWCAGWTFVFLLAVHLPKGFASLVANYGAVAIALVTGWIGTTVAGVVAGRNARGRSDEPSRSSGRMSGILAGLAPTLFMLGYLMLLSFGVHAALSAVSPAAGTTAEIPATTSRVTVDVRVPETAPGIEVDVRGPGRPGWFESTLGQWRPFAANYYDVFALSTIAPDGSRFDHWDRPRGLVLLLAIYAVAAWVASLRININEFSLHHFYKNRIVRCYLGASNTRTRNPNSLTGFDPADDFPISKLVPTDKTPYHGPYPVVNAALNVNTGSELATQERKAVSFVFTPEYCGFAAAVSDEDRYTVARHKKNDDEQFDEQFEENGYRATKGYGYPEGPALGTAVAISGAAANPNSGYATSGPMAFLLTVFDARLGWWLGNPRWRKASTWPGPGFALKYLLAELIGQATARSRFVNLSDGGHFDNIGLYELVRRRCRYIIVGDSEQDGDLSFGALGGAIRKCRADFGVEIDINPNPIRLSDTGFSKTHCVVGTINYPEHDAEPRASIVGDPSTPTERKNARGWLLYLKSSLTGDEPADVIEYRSRTKAFPHESTGDQFFSESQFESYRRLGLHIIRDAFEGVLLPEPLEKRKPDDPPCPADLQPVFQALTRKWYAPPPLTGTEMSRLNDAYSDLMRRLGEKKGLGGLMSDLAFNAPSTYSGESLDHETHAYIIELIQLMENVHTEYRLEHAANRANPRNAGWMSVCCRWAQRPVVRRIWTQVEKDYNPMFRQFMNRHLMETTVEDVPVGL